MRPTARPLAVALIGVVLLGGSACGKAAEKAAEEVTERAIEAQGGEGASVDLNDDGAVEIETADGSYSAGTGEVPAGWPDDIALPDGLEIVTGTDVAGGGQEISSIIATTEDDQATLAAHFEEELAGWVEANRMESSSDGSTFTAVSYSSGDRTVQLTLSRDAEGTNTVSVSHSVAPTD